MVKSRYTGTSGSRDHSRWFREYGSGEETGYDRTEKLSVRLDDFRKIRGN